MKAPVLNMAGEKVSTVELAPSVFEAKVNRGLMHQALVRQQANARLGTHSAKGRSEVSRTTAKAYRQKGTGRARHGSRRAPIFVGGGVAHGPKPRSYAKKMPRKMRHAALRSALTVKASQDDIIFVDDLTLSEPQTREMASIIDKVVGYDDSALLLMAAADENVERSVRNLSYVKTLRANYLNIRDLLRYDKLVVPLAALDTIHDMLAREEFAVLYLEEEE